MNMIRTLYLPLVLFLLPLSLFAGGNKEIPQIPPVTSGAQYLSPNGDGVKDEAELSFTVKIYVKSKEGYVPEYGLTITDPSGEVLREIVQTEDRDIGFFAALFSGYKEFNLERTVRWDGLDESGSPLPDGVYKLAIWVVDANGNRQESDLDDFIIDTEAPYASLGEPEQKIFSPNGDGNLDTFAIVHLDASEEQEWKGAILDDSGAVVRTWSWEGLPEDFQWDGKDDAGQLLDTGLYSYQLSSEDQAGNSSDEISLDRIQLSRLDTEAALLVDPSYVSPNGDGVQDELSVYFDRSVSDGVLSWRWAVYDSDGTLMLADEGDGAVPEELQLDLTDADGRRFPEGSYRIVHELKYENGNRPQAEEVFTVDLTAPEVELSIEHPVFSPDGDGKRDEARIRFRSNEQVSWEGALLDEEGEELFATDSARTTSLMVWNGLNVDGERAADGEYTVLASFTDRAGNTSWPDAKTVKLDTADVELALTAGKAFSPNGDGTGDSMPIRFESNQYREVESWNLRIVDEEGTTVQEYGGRDRLPESVPWDGSVSEKADFAAASEGRYKALAQVNYMKGRQLRSESPSFLLDTTPPEVEMAVQSSPFAETEEGVEGEVFITLKAVDNDGIQNWSMELLNEKGEVLRVYDGDGDPSGNISWNKRESVSAPQMEASRFSLQLSVSDEGGNTAVFTKAIPLDMLLVKKDGRYYLSVPNIIFGAYKHSLDSAGDELMARNQDTVQRVVNIYDRYPSYDLLLEGHALNIYRGTGREAREEAILQPLTERRAATVQGALEEEGMDPRRISVEAYGGTQPNADVTDRSQWWKVRRVEFVMLPPEVEE